MILSESIQFPVGFYFSIEVGFYFASGNTAHNTNLNWNKKKKNDNKKTNK